MVPHLKYMYISDSTKVTQAKQSKQTAEPIVPQIKWNTDSIEFNGKVHQLPITKDYMLREYSDIFKGIDPPKRIIPHQTEGTVQTSTAPTKISPSSHAISIQSRIE